MKYYTLFLPVFKQGDDLSNYLNDNGSNGSQAFSELAKQYEDAAEICKKVSDCIIKNEKLITVDAGTHHIGFSAPKKAVKELIHQNILQEENFDE